MCLNLINDYTLQYSIEMHRNKRTSYDYCTLWDELNSNFYGNDEKWNVYDQRSIMFQFSSSFFFFCQQKYWKIWKKNFIHSTRHFLNRNKYKNVLITLCNINSIKYPCIHNFYGAIFNVNESYSVSIKGWDILL